MEITPIGSNDDEKLLYTTVVNLARQPDVDPEKIERLFNLQFKLEERQAMKAFHTAMAKFQSECPVIIKRKAANFASKRGGNITYGYAGLDDLVSQIREPMARNGLSYSFNVPPRKEGQTQSVLSVIISHSGGYEKSFSVEYETTSENTLMSLSQRKKAALTFAKRTGLENALGLATALEQDVKKNPAPALPEPEPDPLFDQILKELGDLTRGQTKEEKQEALYRLTNCKTVSGLKSLSSFEKNNALGTIREFISSQKKSDPTQKSVIESVSWEDEND